MPSAMAHFSTESAQNSGRAMNQMPRLSAEEADSGEQLTALCAQNSLGLADISQQRAMDDRQNADPAVRAVSEKLGSDRILSWAIYPFSTRPLGSVCHGEPGQSYGIAGFSVIWRVRRGLRGLTAKADDWITYKFTANSEPARPSSKVPKSTCVPKRRKAKRRRGKQTEFVRQQSGGGQARCWLVAAAA